MKNHIIYSIIFFLFSLNVFAANTTDIDPNFESLYKEGKKQYQTLIQHNATKSNSDDKWYIFGLTKETDWFANAQAAAESNNGSWITDEDSFIDASVLSQLNAALTVLNSGTVEDIELYVCLTPRLRNVLPSITQRKFLEISEGTQNWSSSDFYNYLLDENPQDQKWDEARGIDRQISIELNDLMNKILKSSGGADGNGSYYNIPADANRAIFGAAVFDVDIYIEGISKPHKIFRYGLYHAEQSQFFGTCASLMTDYMNSINRSSIGTNSVEKKISHVINSITSFARYNRCSDEDCSYLLDDPQYANHPYLQESYLSLGTNYFGTAIQNNPCLLLTLEQIGTDYWDVESEYADDVAMVAAIAMAIPLAAAMLGETGAVAFLEDALPLIAEQIGRKRAFDCAGGAVIYAGFATGINHYFLDQPWDEALRNVSYLEMAAACAESMFHTDNPFYDAAIAAEFSCFTGGIAPQNFGQNPSDLDAINPQNFSTDNCIRAAFVAALTQALLKNGGQIGRKLTQLPKAAYAKGLVNIRVRNHLLYTAYTPIMGAVNDATHLKSLLKVSSSKANQVFNNTTVKDEILNSGIFAKFAHKSDINLPTADRDAILDLFLDPTHGSDLLTLFNNNFDNFTEVFVKARTHIDALPDVATKKTFFSDLVDRGDLVDAFIGNPRLVNTWRFLDSKNIIDYRANIDALEQLNSYKVSGYENYNEWAESAIRLHFNDINEVPQLLTKLKNDPELIEEWETLQLDQLTVTHNDLLPINRYWSRANDIDCDLGKRLDINETGGFSNTPNIPGYGVLQLEEFAPSSTTAFSGVFDVQTGRFMVYPSGATTYASGSPIPEGRIVPRRGGHRIIRSKMIQYYDDLSDETIHQRVVGFTMKYETTNQLKVEFFSRGVNGPYNRYNSSDLTRLDFFVPENIRPQIINSLQNELNVIRGYNFDIIAINE